MNCKNKKSGILKRMVQTLMGIAKESRHIKWCRPKTWLKYSIVVMITGSVIAAVLSLFDFLSSLIVTGFSIVPNVNSLWQAADIVLFIISLVLIFLCYITANKGDDVLKGFANTGNELFGTAKGGQIDKKLIRTIWILGALIMTIALAMM